MAAHESVEKAVEKLGLSNYQRHVFLCLGPTCCDEALGAAAWDALKSELKNAGLGNACQRTKAGCLRVCCAGPVLVVYPEGTWYQGMTADRIARFVREHIVGGVPIEEWIFARNPLVAIKDVPRGSPLPKGERGAVRPKSLIWDRLTPQRSRTEHPGDSPCHSPSPRCPTPPRRSSRSSTPPPWRFTMAGITRRMSTT